uniref:Uncharacterized protein n=1 Tax=Oryza nivara TaxID=4536 RepID=A0A0E0G442_ORYNI
MDFGAAEVPLAGRRCRWVARGGDLRANDADEEESVFVAGTTHGNAQHEDSLERRGGLRGGLNAQREGRGCDGNGESGTKETRVRAAAWLVSAMRGQRVLMRDISGKKVGEMGAAGFERVAFRPLDLMNEGGRM